ncbi:uncharacterized protein Hap1MRO34_023170 [Clarias gariepinus]|uniref:uncharacterized protein LOC128509572 n=1 Tax=Clarias gariepinus TaxID=13013 RepID=UPI00234D8618|nr:uncharacterized protein LOC128509572 [Clarias gariepinus]
MQSCSVHHCVLFLLTLTLTTVPPVGQTPVVVKLNQSAVLPCNGTCSSSLKWKLIEKPPNVLAQCNQTSCWSEEGFDIYYEKYLKGDLSLTINTAHYSNRGLYTCECDGNNILNSVRLSIESQVFYNYCMPADHLIMKAPMTVPMELTYISENSTDPYHDPICSVKEDLKLQCKAEYATRVVLKGERLFLKYLKSSDNGVYTIWDKKNNEINFSYILFVKGGAASLGLRIEALVGVIIGALLVFGGVV